MSCDPNILNKPRISGFRFATTHIVFHYFPKNLKHSCLRARRRLHNRMAEAIHKSSLTNSDFINLEQACGCAVPFWPGSVWQKKHHKKTSPRFFNQHPGKIYYKSDAQGYHSSPSKGGHLEDHWCKLSYSESKAPLTNSSIKALASLLRPYCLSSCSNVTSMRSRYLTFRIAARTNLINVKCKFQVQQIPSRHCYVPICAVLLSIALVFFLDVNRGKIWIYHPRLEHLEPERFRM